MQKITMKTMKNKKLVSELALKIRTPNRSENNLKRTGWTLILVTVAALQLTSPSANAQLTDVTQTPDNAGFGIAKSLSQQIGMGRGSEFIPRSSLFIIGRDPFRAIRRGRQIFQRKFTFAQGVGPRVGRGNGSIVARPTIGAGLSDSCSGCHGRPRGAAGVGGTVYTRPDSRDAPHLFGAGLVEQIADEMTAELRSTAEQLNNAARMRNRRLTKRLTSKGVSFGLISASRNGVLNLERVNGVDEDLRVRPFFADGQFFSIRQTIVNAFENEMGMQPVDSDLLEASLGSTVTTPSGMVLNGSLDTFDSPLAKSTTDDPDEDDVSNEIDTALVDHMEFYFLNYFRPATYRRTHLVRIGEYLFKKIECTSCHIPDMKIRSDRRVADVETRYQWDETKFNGFNNLFAEVTPKFYEVTNGRDLPTVKVPEKKPFVVKGIYSDFKKHDLGPKMHERNFDGTFTTHFMTEPLWGVGSTAPYGHDGRSVTLRDIILRHGGEASVSRKKFENLSPSSEQKLLAFLQSLILFPPDDTASTLNPGEPGGSPQSAHGSIKLPVLFNDPDEGE